MALINAEFKSVKDHFLLIVDAELANGWHRLKNNYGFFEQTNLDYRGDRKIHVRVAVDAWPAELGKFADSFPKDHASQGWAGHIWYRLAKGRLHLRTVMDLVESSSLPSSKKNGFYDGPIEIARDGEVRYWLRVWVVLDPPPGRRPGDTRNYDKQPWWPGGLPSLGKRR